MVERAKLPGGRQAWGDVERRSLCVEHVRQHRGLEYAVAVEVFWRGVWFKSAIVGQEKESRCTGVVGRRPQSTARYRANHRSGNFHSTKWSAVLSQARGWDQAQVRPRNAQLGLGARVATQAALAGRRHNLEARYSGGYRRHTAPARRPRGCFQGCRCVSTN